MSAFPLIAASEVFRNIGVRKPKMFPLIATAFLPLRRSRLRERVEPPDSESRQRSSPLALLPKALEAVPTTTMSSDPSPISRALDAMLQVLERYVVPPILEPAPPPPLPPANVLLASVTERTVGLGGRVGTDLRGPFTVAELKGLRVDAVVRFELWGHTPTEVGTIVEELINRLLGDREALRSEGFLQIELKNTGLSENIFAEDAWRQIVEFNALFEFPYLDTDDAASLISRIPIDIDSEFNESTTVVDEMARWDNEASLALELRGPLNVGALTALAFISGLTPTGTVRITRTFDDATGPPASHPTLASFVTATGGDTPAERHAEVIFPSLDEFLAALATFKITDAGLAAMKADGLPDAFATLLEGIKDNEVSGADEFVALLEATIGSGPTTTHKDVILKHAATLKPIVLGDWDGDGVADEYNSVQFRINPAIKLALASDRLDIAFENSAFDEVAVVYLRAAAGPTT